MDMTKVDLSESNQPAKFKISLVHSLREKKANVCIKVRCMLKGVPLNTHKTVVCCMLEKSCFH